MAQQPTTSLTDTREHLAAELVEVVCALAAEVRQGHTVHADWLLDPANPEAGEDYEGEPARLVRVLVTANGWGSDACLQVRLHSTTVLTVDVPLLPQGHLANDLQAEHAARAAATIAVVALPQ